MHLLLKFMCCRNILDDLSEFMHELLRWYVSIKRKPDLMCNLRRGLDLEYGRFVLHFMLCWNILARISDCMHELRRWLLSIQRKPDFMHELHRWLLSIRWKPDPLCDV